MMVELSDVNPFFNRYNPSPQYKELVEEYKLMHKSSDGMFNGRSLVMFVDVIRTYLKKNGCKTLLDYGCGKGYLYTDNFRKVTKDVRIDKPLPEYWELDKYRLYDPGYEEHNNPPLGLYDAVISTDVLEHIPTPDMRWVVQEILTHAQKMVFLNIACMPALKKLRNGDNVHISVHDPYDWCQFLAEISEDFPDLVIYVFFNMVEEEDGFQTKGFKILRQPNIIPLEHTLQEEINNGTGNS
tara:strand:+ start:642 stop:1361 length:720 start_codon:yes stop_codon:yes gene_type:complete